MSMTRTEFFFKELPLLKIFYPCPGHLIKGRPIRDRATLIVSKKHNILGCRGTSCKKCWEEVFDDAD
jgi:hypothetical protein